MYSCQQNCFKSKTNDKVNYNIIMVYKPTVEILKIHVAMIHLHCHHHDNHKKTKINLTLSNNLLTIIINSNSCY